ncbi:hypothetical protein BVU76_03775 [Mycolicibacterium porcinum]|nr:hypothetical protein BVU76_03775 [Mycolicibacterium porcinum]
MITTGGAVRDAAEALRREHGSVSTVICAINRSADPTTVLRDVALSVRAVLTKADLDTARPSAND